MRAFALLPLLLLPFAAIAQGGCPSAGEDATTTICTTTSPVALIDRLAGSPTGGGTWQAPGGGAHSGTFNPGSDPAGIYTYSIPADGSCPAVSAEVEVSIENPPNAGTSASITICSDQASFNMRTQLGGTPQTGGTWTAPGNTPHVSTFDPSSDPGGVYTYTVAGGVCADATAILTITKVNAADAGSDASLTLCSSDAPTALIDILGGTPAAGGTWTGPSGAHSGTFDPAIDPPGAYTYVVTGTSPCTNDSATVTVTVNQLPDAGTNGSITVCGDQPAFSLFGELGGSPDGGGAWTGPGGGAVPANYTPGTSVPGVYTYTVLGQPPCPSATATVTVSQVAPANAGSNASITVCSDDAVFPLIAHLNGNPSAGGTWTGPNGPHGNNFNPANHPGGAYTYTVTGNPPCANKSATLNITVRTAPNAGNNATASVCSNDGNISLIGLLGGTPDSGGSWTGPGGQAHSGTFIPGTSAAGEYTYTVVGQSPCTPATATVTMSVTTAPDAGVGGSLVRCSNDPSFPLLAQLGGSPDAGGSWTGPGGSHNGTFVPGTDQAGTYTYTVAGTGPCEDATASLNISIVAAPNAGSNGDTLICINAGQFPLIGVLNGTPAQNGSWTGPGGSNGTFVPGTSQAGAYTYTVNGQAPCANATATATITVQALPDPGTNGNITVCSNDPPVTLFDQLGGSPASGGTWTGPNGSAHNGTYQPATQPGGIYTYTVPGTAPCPSASSTVQVTRVIAPRAGTDGTITVCSTNGPFQLINVLGGNPDGNGIWKNASNATVSGTFTPGTTPPGTYSYIVSGTAPCANDTAYATVNVNIAPVAGSNASITVCSSDASFPLIGELNGNPDAGGSWTGPGGSAHNGTFIPGTSAAGNYTYLVTGETPCLNATAIVSVAVNQQPVAGTNGDRTVCSTDAPVDLFDELGGNPDPGGNWSGPGPLTGSMFTPGTSAPGTYTYTVNGTSPCTNSTATVTMVVNTAPNAGTGGTITICEDSPEVDLRDGLSSDADLTGTWNDDDATGGLSGHLFSPDGLALGTYDFTYTVAGNGQCASDQTTVQVTIVGALNAGSNGLLNLCTTNTQADLFNGLNGSPQQGGTWTDLDGTGALNGQYFDAAIAGPGTYQFQYEITGSVSCATATSTVTVNVTQAPNAGTDGTANFCSNGSSSPLIDHLTGSPSTGGVWTKNGSTVPANYNPVTHTPGTFVYTVSGNGPCANAQASVVVTETPAPIAGTGGNITVCCSDGPFNMTQSLTGSPQPGSWSFNSNPHVSTFVPCLDDPGVYVYTVPGQGPCNAATASLAISVVDPPDAGSNGSLIVCDNAPSIILLSEMNGADFGGTWTTPGGSQQPATFLYVPGTSTPGDYTYLVSGTGPCPSDSAVLSIFENDAANAGGDVTVTFCSNGSSVDLLTVLPGDPDPNGTWTDPDGDPFAGIFVPGTSQPGDYTYHVEGTSPCAPDSAIVTVNVEAAPNAGNSTLITICSDQNAFSMVQQLDGTPQLGGTWHGPLPSTDPVDGIFFPGTTAPGEYVYTVEGDDACPAATATLEVVVNNAPDAGNNANLSLCSTSGSQSLFPLLGPNAQPGGTWSIQGSTATFSGTFVPSTHTSGTYVYTVSGLAPCSNDVATVNVVLNQAPDAGFNGLATICDDDDPFTLLSQLNGTPQSNGNWTGPLGPHSGIFITGQDTAGVYTFTVNGTAPCANATSQVTVIQNSAPDAGGNGLVQVCSDQPSFQLFDHLTGSPDEGGDWLAPGGTNPFSGTYIPGTSAPGTYTYYISALSPCVNDTAQVTVIENTAADAGCNAVAQICSTTSPFPLIDLLGCSPQANGLWTFGAGGPSHGPIFDPAIDGSGTYVYTVDGSGACPDAIAQVQVTLVTAPSAGSDGSVAACVDDPSISLFNALGGSYTTGGTWANLNNAGTIANGILNATGVPPGTYNYRYIVAGLGPCASDTSIVTVQITNALDAGEDAVADVCESQLIDLFGVLGGSPQAGGTWTDIDASGALLGSVFNANAVQPSTTWRFDHILPPSALCEGDTARVTITVVEGPFAGCDGQLSVCSSGSPVSLSNSLGCSPDGDGTWYDPDDDEHSGQFDPSSDQPGIYLYVVPAVGNCPADSAVVNVSVQPAAIAGNDTTISICSNDDPIVLFDLLPGAQAGGNWLHVQTNTPHNGVYDPATNAPGTYRYTVTAPLPCANAIAQIEVSEPTAPDAGCNASLNICSVQPPVNMTGQLGCSPMPGGTWYDPEGEEHGNFFDPASDAPGPYQYVVQGTEPCSNDTATLVIAVTIATSSGNDTQVDACLSLTEFDLLDALGPSADPGGNWEDVDGSNALNGNIFDPSAAGEGIWTFEYSFPSNGPCAANSSIVTVNVSPGSDAGQDSSVVVCGADPSFDLFSALGGTPDAGGSWLDIAGTGAVQNGNLNAQLIQPGTTAQFGYQINDPGCGLVSATVTVLIADFADPGSDTTITVCVISDPIDLFDHLGGTPEEGGTWLAPGNQPHDGIFDPGSDPTGAYTYNMPPTEHCPALSAQLFVQLTQLADAGDDATFEACDNLTELQLITGLGGSPQPGGTWTDLDGTLGEALNEGTLNTTLLQPGSYDLQYNISIADCGSDSAHLTVIVIGSVSIGEVQLTCNEQDRTYTVSFPIENGDPSTYSVSGLSGTISSSAPHIFTSAPIPTSQPFEATIDDASGCANLVIEGTSPCEFTDEIFIPESFSPNDDGINDLFIIPGIEGFPGNKIVIFNRWGDKVFEASGYDNSSVVWDGSSLSALIQGKAPAGTYFYVLELAEEMEAFTGYIYLNR